MAGRFCAGVVLLLAGLGAGVAPAAQGPDGSVQTAPDRTLALIRDWVRGTYDNAAQFEADVADDAIPDERKHRLVHQVFVPVTVSIPALEGYLVFQQSSADGSYAPETINRVGLLQYLKDPVTGVVRQRELNFRDVPAWRDAHRDPERLRTLTPADFTIDPGCDFLLRTNGAGTEVSGRIPAGSCRIRSEGLGKTLIADDFVTIRADEYWFLGRFVDESGAVMWGNSSDEPFRMVRRAATVP